MKIKVRFEPSDYRAYYFYSSWGNGGKCLVYGAQFEMKEVPEDE